MAGLQKGRFVEDEIIHTVMPQLPVGVIPTVGRNLYCAPGFDKDFSLRSK
jgi:hypothetical protein